MLRYPAKAYIIPKRWTKLSQIKIPQHGINTDTVKGAIDLNGIFIHRKRVFGDIEVPPGTHVSLYFNSIILRELVSPGISPIHPYYRLELIECRRKRLYCYR